MDVRTTSLEGVLLVQPPTVHEDFRGLFVETYNQELYRQAGIDVQFVQDDVSISHKGVLRGLHGDGQNWKLVTCLQGRVYLVVVNWDAASPQYKKWESTLGTIRHRTDHAWDCVTRTTMLAFAYKLAIAAERW